MKGVVCIVANAHGLILELFEVTEAVLKVERVLVITLDYGFNVRCFQDPSLWNVEMFDVSEWGCLRSSFYHSKDRGQRGESSFRNPAWNPDGFHQDYVDTRLVDLSSICLGEMGVVAILATKLADLDRPDAGCCRHT